MNRKKAKALGGSQGLFDPQPPRYSVSYTPKGGAPIPLTRIRQVVTSTNLENRRIVSTLRLPKP